MATNLTGTTIASTYEKLLKRADTYVAAGVNVEVQNDSAVAAASSLYLDITNGNVGIGDTLPSEAKLSIGSVAASDYALKIDNNQNTNSIYIDSEATTSVINIDAPVSTSGNIIYTDPTSLTTGSAFRTDCSSTALETTISGGLVEISQTGNTGATVNNVLFVKNDDASSIGTTGIYVQQDSTGPAISTTGGIVEQGGTLKENLLTNSGFDVWSNSTLETATALLTGDEVDMDTIPAFGDTTSWYGAQDGITTSVAGGVSGNALKCLNNYGSPNGISVNINVTALTVGKLYRLKFSIKHDGSMGEDIQAYMSSVSTQTIQNPISLTSSYVTQTYVFEATYANTKLTFATIGNQGDDEFWLMDNVTLDEVTPGCVGASGVGPDGHSQDSTLDTWRQYDDSTYTKGGSFYSLKTLNGATDRSYYITSGIETNPVWLERLAGRTLTFGCWVYTTQGSHARLGNYDGSSYEYSSYAGTSAWEWLEVTRTFGASPTYGRFFLHNQVNSAVSYWSQPMLVFGSSIGSGNYTRPQGEMVYGEATYDLTGFAGTAIGDVGSATDINLEATSNGKIPKGAKAIYYRMGVYDPDVQTGSPFFELYGIQETSGHRIMFDNLGGDEWDDKLIEHVNWLPCNSSGDVSYASGASGSATLNIRLRIMGVQLR